MTHPPHFYGKPDREEQLEIIDASMFFSAVNQHKSPDFFINIGLMLVVAGMHGKRLVGLDDFLLEIDGCIKQSYANLEAHAASMHAEQ